MNCCVSSLFLGCFKNCECINLSDLDLIDPATGLELIPEIGDWIFEWNQDGRTYHNSIYPIDLVNTELKLSTYLFNADNHVCFKLYRPDGSVFFTIVDGIEYDCFTLKVNQFIDRTVNIDCNTGPCDICDISTHGFTIIPTGGPIYALALNTLYENAGNYTFTLLPCTQHVYLKSVITLLNGSTSINNPIEYNQVAEDFNNGFYYSFNLVNFLPALLVGDILLIQITFIASSTLPDGTICSFEYPENLIINII